MFRYLALCQDVRTETLWVPFHNGADTTYTGLENVSYMLPGLARLLTLTFVL